MSILWSFTPLDSCFFREAKPFNAGEGGFLNSQFPSPGQTLAGSFRNTIGEWLKVDWKDYKENPDNPVRKQIGSPDNPSPLSFSGTYILRGRNRLYSAPFYLLYKYEVGKEQFEWARIQPGEKITTDIGEVSLPEPDIKIEGGKIPERIWLSSNDIVLVLNGGTPTGAIAECELVRDESRAGIGRNNQKSVVEEGLLYFVRHLRLCDDVAFAIEVEGLPDTVNAPQQILTRMGGEGRLADLSRIEGIDTMPIHPTASGSEKGLILTLLTHGDFNGKPEPDWDAVNSAYGVNLTLKSACVGKPVREGGWDYVIRQPKPLNSLVPAGSGYFVQINGDINQAINALHGKKLGSRTEFGYGEIAVGLWK